MADTSDALPVGGYVAPLIPPEWFQSPAVLLAVCSGLDVPLDDARLDMDGVLTTHQVATAVGGDLEALGGLVGVGRLPGEDDKQYRARIPATVRHGIAASTAPDMAAYLAAALGLPVTVQTGPAATASFTVTVVGNPGTLTSVPGLIRRAKAAGTVFLAQAVIPSAGGSAGGRLGERRLDESVLGGGNAAVPLGD